MILGFVLLINNILYEEQFNTIDACETVMQMRANEYVTSQIQLGHADYTHVIQIKCIEDR